MDDDELREVGDSIEKGDEIVIGRLDIELTVKSQPTEDNTGALIITAERRHQPEQDVVTNVLLSLGHPSGGENLEISTYELEEASKSSIHEYHIGERLEMNHYKLQQLSLVD